MMVDRSKEASAVHKLVCWICTGRLYVDTRARGAEGDEVAWMCGLEAGCIRVMVADSSSA